MSNPTPLETAARRKTKANSRVRLLTGLLAQAQQELTEATAEFADAKLQQAALV